MQKYIHIALALLLSIMPAMAQQQPQAPRAAQNQGQAQQGNQNKDQRPKSGLRFVLLNDQVPTKTVYIPTSKTTFKKVELRPGLPGDRIAYPESGRLIFLEKAPELGSQEKPVPVLNMVIPEGVTAKTLGLVGAINNKFYVIFVDELQLTAGRVLFKNMTNTSYMISMPDAPLGEPKQFELKGSSDHMFGEKSNPPTRTKTYRTIIYHALVPDGATEAKWFVNRRFMTTSYTKRSMIYLFVPNSTGKEMEMQQIQLFPESNQTGEQ